MSANLTLVPSFDISECGCPACSSVDRLVALLGKIDAIDFALIEEGAAPMPETIDAIVRHLAKLYPNGGNQFCAAIEQAVRLAWRARHEIQKIRETQ